MPETILTVAAARTLPIPEGRRSAEILRKADVEIRFYAPQGHDPQTPHDQDEFYVVAAGTGKFRVDGRVTPFGPGDLLFAAAHAEHRFEDFSDDFAVWVLFYGPRK
ncbi:MAG TPA: cupin domain-containing protein [Stellaceae bacterium]|nr:cupin domain-containing protein [Stellaceae bacterium]